MYIGEKDLNQWITSEQLEEAKKSGSVDTSIKYALNRIESKIKHKYKTSEEFAKTGDNRNLTLVKIACDITIWYLAQALELNDMEGKFYQLFEKAEEDLKNIELGKMATDLPTYSDDDDVEEERTIEYGESTSINENIY